MFVKLSESRKAISKFTSILKQSSQCKVRGLKSCQKKSGKTNLCVSSGPQTGKLEYVINKLTSNNKKSEGIYILASAKKHNCCLLAVCVNGQLLSNTFTKTSFKTVCFHSLVCCQDG